MDEEKEMEINEAVEKAMEFAWEKAVNDYREGKTIKHGPSLFGTPLIGKKYVSSGITIKEDFVKHIVHFSTDYPRDGYKAELYVDKKREVLKVLRRRCEAEGIVYEQYKDSTGHLYYVSLLFPLHLVQEKVERRDAEVREFKEALNTRRMDVVEKLADVIIKNSTQRIIINSHGLRIDHGDTSNSIFQYQELGLEPIDCDGKVKVLAEAVVANLNNRGDEHYKLWSSSAYKRFWNNYYIEKEEKTEKVKLSKW